MHVQKQSPAAAPSRPFDLRFYRAVYEDAAALADAELLAAAAAGRLPAERMSHPSELIRHALANKLLPHGFDLVGYRIRHPELWGADRADWEVVLHCLKSGTPRMSADRPFDPAFYRDAYLPDRAAGDVNADPGADAAELAAHRRAHPNAYGSLDEALMRNGWRSRDWVACFDHQSYAVCNTLTERFATRAQLLLHFIEEGWRAGLAMSAECEFDPAYYLDLAGAAAGAGAGQDTGGLYRLWIEHGLPGGAPANEAAHLRVLGLNLPCYPAGFDWRAYLEERPEITPTGGRWTALEHLVEHGLSETRRAIPIDPATLPHLLLAAADRLAIARREDESTRLYDRGLLFPDPPVMLLRHAADQAFRRGSHARALELYRRERAAGVPGFWAWVNAARAALALGAPDDAAEWVLGGLRQHPRSETLFGVLLEIQQATFEQAMARHLGALRAGRRETGLAACLDAILARFVAAAQANAAPAPPRTPGARLRVAVLANKDLPQCTHYRVEQKREQLAAAGDVDLDIFERSEGEAFRSAVATADIAIFYRLAADVEMLRSVAACRAAGVPTVYEIDDLVFDPAAFPDPLGSYGGAITPDDHFGLRAGVALVRHALTVCDAGIASTEALAAHMRPLVRSGAVLVHRNGLSAALAAAAIATEPPAAQERITLFYGSFTKAHAADFRTLLAPALTRLMAEDPRIRFVACGHVDAAALAARFPAQVTCLPPIADRDAYLAQLLDADINLAVLQAGAFNDCKSEIKWLEAAAFCVPSVVSDVAGYRETLRKATHVLRVAPEADAWYEALRGLVQDPVRRAAIGRAARDLAVKRYAPAAAGRTLAGWLRRIVAPGARRGTPAAVQRPRVLLANVFFPPQAIGGATRVMRDQAAEMIARYGDAFELGILCGNDEEAAPYRVDCYGLGGIPVWSIGCPRREHMDWTGFDPAMAAPVGAVLDRFRPDLVHAHCIQRLTATALEAVAARQIPYVVTVHDAWWISDHQFLVDGQDRLRMPWDAERFASGANPHDVVTSRTRRARLRHLLGGARAVLAVSRGFAEVYRRAGVAKTVAVANGLPHLPELEPQAAPAGRVRIAHLGGTVAHKGYFLLRQAVSRGRFRNLDLLVLDHALRAGEQREAMWGTTPVRIAAKRPQPEVGALYGMIDVLAAPSLWPESYGLVAREALHYRKWVIAGARGAIGEDVVPGENGWIVDVADAAALSAVLTEIDADPARYAAPPELRTRTRGVAEQVDEVVGIYRRILGPAA